MRGAEQRRAEGLEQQVREMERLRKLRERSAAAPIADDPVAQVLRSLVEHIQASSYFDQHGQLLELNPVFIQARELLRGEDS